ncbi:hypothetical protein BZZ01_30960 [Nostocales cyanobacterium HT-58-2]|nr:hypothetical protein BZZ01_30960 [Nostocales cyanobacterium HT-58-2]
MRQCVAQRSCEEGFPQPQRQSAQVGKPAHAAGSFVGTPKPLSVQTAVAQPRLPSLGEGFRV